MPRIESDFSYSAERIVEACQSPKHERIYCVGSFGQTVNFSAQQYRAFNLIWALDMLGRVPKESAVAVIGAGLTGVTAAAALVRLGYKVDLFEARKELMAHQLTTDHRLVHPTINSWPKTPLQPSTNFPFLNWVSGPCSKVIFGILSEIEKMEADTNNQFAIHRNRRITDISKGLNGYLLQTSRKPLDKAYSTIILALGFGEEREHPDFRAVSYWYPDGVERAALIGDVDNFVVSGCGDGGLIDALRILHRDFDKGGIIFETANALEKSALAQELIVAEDSYPRASKIQDAYESAARKIIEDKLYENVHYLLKHSIGNCRPRVYLSSRDGENPFVSRAAPIHKLLIAHAMVMNKAVYIRSRLNKDHDMLMLDDKRFPISEKTLIVVRHGPVGPPLEGIIDQDSIDNLSSAQIAIEKMFTSAAWPDGYLEIETEKVKDRALRMYSDASRAIRLVAPNSVLNITEDGYRVKIFDMADAAKIPPEIFGIPIEIGHVEIFIETKAL